MSIPMSDPNLLGQISNDQTLSLLAENVIRSDRKVEYAKANVRLDFPGRYYHEGQRDAAIFLLDHACRMIGLPDFHKDRVRIVGRYLESTGKRERNVPDLLAAIGYQYS